MMKKNSANKKLILFTITPILLLLSSCSNSVEFDKTKQSSQELFSIGPGGGNGVTPCGEQSCSLEPLTDKPAVTTILLALGDKKENTLVGNAASNQFIAESVVRYSSPVRNPKIVIVRAYARNGEDLEDTEYVQQLLSRYSAAIIDEPKSGLLAQDVEPFDLIWFNNPGHKFTSATSFSTLLNFDGSVVLQGDDLAASTSFLMTPLTGLTFVDNGA